MVLLTVELRQVELRQFSNCGIEAVWNSNCGIEAVLLTVELRRCF